ncbi:iron-containing alcohol dehydrogenase family protein [Zongyangia hominis]|uniref:Iron-containing alcohol dehydrogenase n=1 Tax=Zongyangia hominis TaxID=2763677 RepID=A0A926EEV8_9FIRM|nr:iron-containing alcohol dehydrogenase family protein [Zongyangia hominis]MBC8570596.1 iron-containing alcohol dehydrogenase [Zongyangia hominis]
MNFNMYMPARVTSGEDCVLKNSAALKKLGDKCLIVTGKHSAKACGALDDVTAALDKEGIGYQVFDEVVQNPYVMTCHKAGQIAREMGAQFILGIGGGSPLDSTKAVAVFASNPQLSGLDIYGGWQNRALPFVLVGTTAGTGSEVTAVSVLTNDATGQKKSFKSDETYAALSFGDPKYTYSLNYDFTVSTALDAFAHCLEGLFAAKGNEVSDAYALRGISILGGSLIQLYMHKGDSGEHLPHTLRERLYYASLYGGLVINITGTTFCHALSYVLTEDYHIAHGKACAIFLPEYIHRAQEAYPKKFAGFEAALGTHCETFVDLIKDLARMEVKMTPPQIEDYLPRFKGNANFQNTPGVFTLDDTKRVLTELFV